MPAQFDTRRPRPESAERVIGPGGLPTYLISDEELAHGSSLGNAACWVPTKSTGAVERVFALNAGLDVFGACVLKYSGSGLRVPSPQPSPPAPLPPSGAEPERFAQLEPSSPGSFEIHPAYQRHRFSLPGELEVEETVFLPWQGPEVAVPTVWVGVRVRNHSPKPRRLRVYCFADLCGRLYPDTAVTYDPGIGALVVRNPGRPGWSRMVAFDRPPSGYEAVRDRSRAYEPYDNPPLSNRTDADGDVLAALQLDLELPPHGADSFCWLLCFSPDGEEGARAALRRAQGWEGLLNQSVSWCSEVLSATRVMVPEKSIADGVLWAKANMLRVMGSYPTGAGFTNDPGRSSNVVVRDVAWFVFGCDHLMPEYSAELLRNAAGYQQESGKMVEYWSALTGESEDYGLNINDATPLFVMAAGHHCLVTHDRTFLREIYPAASRAARYLLSQRDERGLVFCGSTEVGERGICGWRNVIPNYRLSGAVTEVNAECYAALRTVAEMARALGRTEELGDFLDAAVGLGDAINTHLLNPTNGLYYLTIDPTGLPDTEVTCDQVFPVMFGPSPSEVSFRIISRLARPDFWTPAGLRTASSSSPDYTPDRDWGLRGGVWPGVTFWYAFAAARHHPESMERALESFRHYNENPLRYNTVPGQFSEWFDGESLANRGMRLSPWEPPRMVWAAIEGTFGVVHSLDGCVVQPLVPSSWKWLAVRDLPHADRSETMFLARVRGELRLYGALHRLTSSHPVERYERDVSQLARSLHPDASLVALRRQDEILVCVGSSADGTVTVPIELRDLLSEELWYYLELYDSELDDWVRGMMRRGDELRELAVPVETRGFRLLRLTPVRM